MAGRTKCKFCTRLRRQQAVPYLRDEARTAARRCRRRGHGSLTVLKNTRRGTRMKWTEGLRSAIHRLRLRREFSGRVDTPHHRISNPWHAVSVESGLYACRAALDLRGKRMLSREAPVLPLVACPHADQCTCRFRHHADRRAVDRRARDAGLPTGAFLNGTGPERRGPSHGRRKTDV